MVVLFFVFLGFLIAFHVSEFCLAQLYMRDDLSNRSWLISKPYLIAMIAASAEYWLEGALLPGMKAPRVGLWGIVPIMAGEAVRKAAMITAGQNFTHLLKVEKRGNHVLIKHGVYRYFRHPGYFGFMLWALGMQLLLVNPLCILAFTAVLCRFFSERIAVEEDQLLSFFGSSYMDYAKQTPIRIPFVAGLYT